MTAKKQPARLPVYDRSGRRLERIVPLLSAILIPVLIACGVASSKSNTSAPSTDNLGDYLRICDERMKAIRDWESNQMRKIEDEWIEGQRGMLQSGAKALRIEEEATAMRNELRRNCDSNEPDLRIAAKDLGISGCVDAEVVRSVRAESQADQDRTREKYTGQRLCARGKITGFTGGTLQGRAQVFVGKEGNSFDTEFELVYMIRNGQRESWAESLWVGKVVEAECTVRDVLGGALMFEDCDLRGR